jgi:tetratricopeptide (TPR) repeat protein
MNPIKPRLAVCLLCLASAGPLAAQTGEVQKSSRPPLSAQEWREDLHYMAAQMRLKHKALFHSMTEAEFNGAVDALDADIPRLNEDEIIVRLAQLVAMVQDGHSGLDLRPVPPSPDLKDHIPVRFERYADGVYVRAASQEYADAVGGKVIKVGSVDWQEAMQRVDSIESHDAGNNGEQFAWSAKTSLNCPRLLHGLGISTSSDSADFVIEKDGKRRTIMMKASVPIGLWYLNAVPTDWVDARPKSAPAPLSTQHEDQPFWFTALPEQHAVYFQFNLVYNGDEESLADFSKRLATALDQPDVQRLVIDMRNNTGGDNTLLRPLLIAVIRSKVNRRGGIYVITSSTTFSAAQNFVNRLQNYTEAIIVGEPTAENVNFYGDPVGFTLPHSQLEAAVSQLWWQDCDPRDKRVATAPEIVAEATFHDYVAGVDPVLRLALTMPTPPTLEEFLEEGLTAGLETTQARYQAYVNDPAHKYAEDLERHVNALGYKLLSAKRVQDAITIFEVNARAHPKSANAYDSLGEGYADAKDKQHALDAYRRSLELNPGNENAKRMIELIENAK